MRHLLADTPRAELEKKYLDHYAHAEPGISLAKPLEVADAPDEDLVTLTETYRVPPVHDGDERDFWAEAVGNAVPDPRTALRKLPLAVEHPVHVREEVRIELPGPAAVAPEGRTVATETARLTRSAEVKGSTVKIAFDYRSLADRAPVEKVPEHLRALRSMRDLASFTVPLEVARAGASGRSRAADAIALATVLAAFAGVGLVLAYASSGGNWVEKLRRWRRKRAFAARFKAEPGDSAEVPLDATDVTSALARASRGRCACGGALGGAAVAERVIHGGREVLVLHAPCTRCASGGRRVYVRIW
jgi:hypothetical protein